MYIASFVFSQYSLFCVCFLSADNELVVVLLGFLRSELQLSNSQVVAPNYSPCSFLWAATRHLGEMMRWTIFGTEPVPASLSVMSEVLFERLSIG